MINFDLCNIWLKNLARKTIRIEKFEFNFTNMQ